MGFYSEKLVDPKIYDRIMKSANFCEADRVPIWDYMDNRYALEHFAPGETDLLKANVRVYHGLGIDLCRGFGESFSQEQNGQGTQAGCVETLVSGQTRWETKHAVRTMEDLKAFDFQPPPIDYYQNSWLPWLKTCQEAFAPKTMFVPCIGCGFHASYSVMGLETFSTAIYDAPEALQRLLDNRCEEHVRYAQVAGEAKACPLCMVGDDIAYKGRLMFSPAFLRRTFIPMLRRVCDALHAHGVKVMFHSDGNVMEILDDMIEAGIDGLNPIEPIAGMDIALLKKKYHGKLILLGNVDCSQVLPLGTKEQVIEAVKNCIRDASAGGGHFIGSSSEVTPSTPLENILAFYRTVHEFGRYPINLL